jgi:hypothetical protein
MFKYRIKNLDTGEVLKESVKSQEDLENPFAPLIGKSTLKDLHDDIPEHEDDNGNSIPFSAKNYEVIKIELAEDDHPDMKSLRRKRDLLLKESDWTQLPDSPLNASDKNAWKTYRQELRDLPANTVDPTSPSWPSEPS